jgi:hypothetical protein
MPDSPPFLRPCVRDALTGYALAQRTMRSYSSLEAVVVALHADVLPKALVSDTSLAAPFQRMASDGV